MLRLLTAAVAVLLAVGPVLAGQSGEERFYDSRGQYRGRSSQDAANAKQKSLYDAKGKYEGRVMTDPATGESRVYDQHGKYLGRASGGQTPKNEK